MVTTLLRAARSPGPGGVAQVAVIRARHRGRTLGAPRGVGPRRPVGSRPSTVSRCTSRGPTERPASAASPLPGMAPLADALASGILAADQTGAVVYANAAAAELFWMAPAALLEHGWLAPIHIDDLEEVQAAAAAALSGLAHQDVSFQLWIDADHARWVHARFSGLRSSTGRDGWVAALEDITTRRAAEHELSFQATHDALTGLPDRLLLRDRLEQGIARLDRHDATLGVLFIDLDGFKAVNDEHGHAVGRRRAGPGGRRASPARCDPATPRRGSVATSSSSWPTTSTRPARWRSPIGWRARWPDRSGWTRSRSSSARRSA